MIALAPSTLDRLGKRIKAHNFKLFGYDRIVLGAVVMAFI
jgi:hypothetical protein